MSPLETMGKYEILEMASLRPHFVDILSFGMLRNGLERE